MFGYRATVLRLKVDNVVVHSIKSQKFKIPLLVINCANNFLIKGVLYLSRRLSPLAVFLHPVTKELSYVGDLSIQSHRM